MMSSLGALAAEPRRSRRAAGSLVTALLFGYAAIIYFVDNDNNTNNSLINKQQESRRGLEGPPSTKYRRSLELVDSEYDSRVLAKNGASPSELDEVPGQFIIKPWVGNAAADIWESREDTKVVLSSCQASTVQNANLLPRYIIDDPNLGTRWASSPSPGVRRDEEWINIDMGLPQSVTEFYIEWADAYAVDYSIMVAHERPNCRSNGDPCPDAWVTVAETTGKTNSDPSHEIYDADDHSLQGVRYVRVKLSKRAPGYNNFSIYYLRVYRKKMIIGENPTGITCGGTVSAAASSLLGNYGGNLIQSYENAEFFSATMTEAQKDAMFEDPCVFTVEPNYIVRARGRSTVRGEGGAAKGEEEEAVVGEDVQRRLAIPEFNLKDENPPSWGLQRISSHGKLNGMYIWFHEGAGTDMYIFDTGVYPLHSDWNDRNDTSRMVEPLICAGTATDYASNDHGTHIASIAAGFTFGIAKSTTIHPIQVLDANGEGTTASVLCGVEQLLADGKAYNEANAPRKFKGIVNLSLGVNGRSDALDKVVKDMTDVGYTVVIAAGDHNDNACFYSPYDKTAITVGAISDAPLTGYNDKTSTSNYGECIDLWAPGEGIYGASNVGEYEQVMKSGTSVASSFVAGSAALFFEEVNDEEYGVEEFAAGVKEKIIYKAEVNILGKLGHGSVNKMAQTTSSRCLINSHCQTGLTCLRDGTCADLSKPLKRTS